LGYRNKVVGTLSAKELAGLYLRLATPELLEKPDERMDQSSVEDIVYSIVRSTVNNAALSIRGLKEPDESEQALEIVGIYVIEELLFCLHMVDRLAFLDSTIDKRCAFMDSLVAGVADLLWRSFGSAIDVSRFLEYFVDVYNQRQKEYASYNEVLVRRARVSGAHCSGSTGSGWRT